MPLGGPSPEVPEHRVEASDDLFEPFVEPRQFEALWVSRSEPPKHACRDRHSKTNYHHYA